MPAGAPPPPTTSTTCCIASVRLFFRASELGSPQVSSVSCLPEKPEVPEKTQRSCESGKRERWASRFPRMRALRSVCASCTAFWKVLFGLSHHHQNVQITKGEKEGEKINSGLCETEQSAFLVT